MAGGGDVEESFSQKAKIYFTEEESFPLKQKIYFTVEEISPSKQKYISRNQVLSLPRLHPMLFKAFEVEVLCVY